jgi:hypothetical protein
LLDEKGLVLNAVALNSTEGFREYRKSVAETVSQSTFRPGKRGGKPVRTVVFQTVYFDPNAYANARREAAEVKSEISGKDNSGSGQ